jgi:hypothetical protein
VILRVLAVVALLGGGATLLGYLHYVGKSPSADLAARHLRQMKDRAAAPDTVLDFTYERFAALPIDLPVAEYAELERTAVRLEGHVQRVQRAADDDFHLEIVPEHRGPDARFLPYATGEITPQWHRDSPNWRYDRIIELFRPNLGGVTRWDRGTRRVRISGWLLYDYQKNEPRPNPTRHITQWEIHPVTRIEAWDDSLGAFVEYAR